MTDSIKGDHGQASSSYAERGPNESAGSNLYMVNGRRQLKAYVLTEDNLESLSILDVVFNVCLALGCAFFSFAGGIKLAISFASESTNKQVLDSWDAFYIACIVIGSICISLCLWSLCKRRGSLNKIKTETKHDE